MYFDLSMGIRRVQNLPHEHPRQAEIVGVFPRASGLMRSVDHGGRLADDGETVIHVSSLCCCANIHLAPFRTPSDAEEPAFAAGGLYFAPRLSLAFPRTPDRSA